MINVDTDLRDGIHTNQKGAKIYADNIIKFIDKEEFKQSIKVEKNELCNLQYLKVEKELLELKLETKNLLTLKLLCIIGPKSSQINVNGKIYDVWDKWCHYQRIKIIEIRVTENNHVTILVVDKNNETTNKSLCKVVREWPERSLYVKGIIYVGELKII